MRIIAITAINLIIGFSDSTTLYSLCEKKIRVEMQSKEDLYKSDFPYT